MKTWLPAIVFDGLGVSLHRVFRHGNTAVISAGLSLSFAGSFSNVLLSAPVKATGIALGMTLLLNRLGQSMGPTIAAMYQVTMGSGRFPTVEEYNVIFVTAAAISLASVALSSVQHQCQVVLPVDAADDAPAKHD